MSKIQRYSLKFPDGELSVRALTEKEVITILRPILSDFAVTFEFHITENPVAMMYNDDLINRFSSLMLNQGAQVIGDIIALAADEPAMAREAAKLPIDVAIITVKEIWKLTIPDHAALHRMTSAIGDAAFGQSMLARPERH